MWDTGEEGERGTYVIFDSNGSCTICYEVAEDALKRGWEGEMQKFMFETVCPDLVKGFRDVSECDCEHSVFVVCYL